jgi:hypothetical protein
MPLTTKWDEGYWPMIRRFSNCVFGVALVAAAAGTACSSSNTSGDDVKCGPGTSLDASVCYVESVAPLLDAGADVGDTGTVGDAGPPSAVLFAGATALAPASTKALLVTWVGANEAAADSGVFTYRIYVSTTPGGENFAVPTAESAPGATSFVIDTGLAANTKYYVVVRAVDASGHQDDNTAEQSATTQVDTMAPSFEGVTSVTPAPEASLAIAWQPATDDLTPQAGIVYDVFLSSTSGGENLNLPDAVSAPGATSLTVHGLALAGATYYVVVRAVDAAGNVDTSLEDVIEKSGMSGTDDISPVFGGCTSAVGIDAQSIAVSWASATDNSTPAAQIAYDVYAATTQGGQDFTHPTQTFMASAGATPLTGGLVGGLDSDTAYYLVCRARDLSGNEDQNIFARVATTAIDSSPPKFAGVSGNQSVTATTVELFWNMPATDNETPTSEIVYVAYQATASGAEIYGDGGAPVATSTPGAMSMTITGLTPDTTYYWVVRAEDRAGNIEADLIETTATTPVSFSQNVAPIFGQHCAISGCHVPGNPPVGLVLVPAQAYSFIVSVYSKEYTPDFRVAPGDSADSYLYLKVTGTASVGTQMPPPSTLDSLSSTELGFIQTWIDQGAANN